MYLYLIYIIQYVFVPLTNDDIKKLVDSNFSVSFV